jgi:hypothetical protein
VDEFAHDWYSSQVRSGRRWIVLDALIKDAFSAIALVKVVHPEISLLVRGAASVQHRSQPRGWRPDGLVTVKVTAAGSQ